MPLLQSEKGVSINDKMPLFAYDFLKRNYKQSLENKKILLLGVSYLNDVGDTRYTPVEPFYDYLLKENASIVLHDPHIPFWEEKGIFVSADLDLALEQEYDIIVISTGHRQYRNNPTLIETILNQKNVFVLDAIGVLSEQEIKTINQKHTAKVVGRGDI